MLIHVDPVRVWAHSAVGVVIGMTLSSIINDGSWEIVFPALIVAGISAGAASLLAMRKRYEILIDREALRAPMRQGWRVRPTHVPVAGIDLTESHLRRCRSSVLKLKDGRRIVLPSNLYRPRDIRALFEEIERRTPA